MDRQQMRTEQDQRQSQRIRDENAARAELACAECGTDDGMIGLDTEHFHKVLGIQTFEELQDFIRKTEESGIEWYALPGDTEVILYHPCPTCRPTVPPEYRRLGLERPTPSDEAAWELLKVIGGDCACVLPGQSCPVCRAAARVVAGEDEIPY